MRRFLMLAVALTGCAHVPAEPKAVVAAPPPPAEVAPVASVAPADAPGLRFVVDPIDSEVFIDGKSYGKAAELSSATVAVKPGLYQVSLKRQGYKTFRAEISVGTTVEQIQITMVRD